MADTGGSMRRIIPSVTLLITLWWLPLHTVDAHPFGPPPTARISATGNVVTLDWSATPDDAAAIGERLGVMPEGSVAAYRQEGAAQVAPSARDEARLSASPQLREYLTANIVVSQNGSPCSPSVGTIDDFVHAGARMTFTCAEPVDQATLRITMLHDIHTAYRTVAVGTRTDPAESVFTTAAPEHTWRFGVEPGSSRNLPLAALAAMTLAAAGAVAAAVALRWRRR